LLYNVFVLFFMFVLLCDKCLFLYTVIDECDSEPCWGVGTMECLNLDYSYQCSCLPRYTGRHCEAGKYVKLEFLKLHTCSVYVCYIHFRTIYVIHWKELELPPTCYN